MHNGFMYVLFGYNGLTDKHFNDFYKFDPGMKYFLKSRFNVKVESK